MFALQLGFRSYTYVLNKNLILKAKHTFWSTTKCLDKSWLLVKHLFIYQPPDLWSTFDFESKLNFRSNTFWTDTWLLVNTLVFDQQHDIWLATLVFAIQIWFWSTIFFFVLIKNFILVNHLIFDHQPAFLVKHLVFCQQLDFRPENQFPGLETEIGPNIAWKPIFKHFGEVSRCVMTVIKIVVFSSA